MNASHAFPPGSAGCYHLREWSLRWRGLEEVLNVNKSSLLGCRHHHAVRGGGCHQFLGAEVLRPELKLTLPFQCGFTPVEWDAEASGAHVQIEVKCFALFRYLWPFSSGLSALVASSICLSQLITSPASTTPGL